MNNNIKDTFDKIKADTQLKNSVFNNIYEKLYSKKNRRHNARRFMAIAATCAAAFVMVMGTNIYNSQAIYIGLDINPSISLSVNRFNKVIGVNYYNDESREFANNLNLLNKDYGDAIKMIMDDPNMLPYLNEARTLYVTVQANDGTKVVALENSIENIIDTAIQDCHSQSQVEYTCIDEQTRLNAEGSGISAAKYAAIIELQKYDPSVSVESYKHHSIYDINTELEAHHSHTHEDGHECTPEENCPHEDHSDSVQCQAAQTDDETLQAESVSSYNENTTVNVSGSLKHHYSGHE